MGIEVVDEYYIPDEYTKKARSSAGFDFVLRYLADPDVLRMLVKCFVLWV